MNKKSGRPESFHSIYFSHSVHESDTLKWMYRKYKYEGYTAYFRLLEQVAKADLHRVELKNETQISIFQMNMDVKQEVTDFLISLLLQTGEMNREQWENDQTIYLDKFVKQFRSLWHKRGKSIPDSNGNFINHSQKQESNKVSGAGNVHNRIEYNKIQYNTREDKDPLLSFDEYEKLYPNADVNKSLKKFLEFNKNPSNRKARDWLAREKNKKPISFQKTPTGFYKAWCSKCGKKHLPNDFQLKQGSDCCRVGFVNERPQDQQSVSSSSIKNNLSNNV